MGFDATERLAVEINIKRADQLAILPAFTQRRRRHQHGRQGRSGLGLNEAEALGQFIGDQATQRNIVDQADQANGLQCFLAAGALAHVAGDDDDFGFEIEAPNGIMEGDGFAWAQELVAAALIHQRILPETFRQFGAACPADQFDMVHIGRSVGPLERAWQGCRGGALVEPRMRNRVVRQ